VSITQTDYYRKGHIFLESSNGRKDIFELFREEIIKGLEKVEGFSYISAIRTLEDYLMGDLDNELPNIHTLRKSKDDIKQDSLAFLRDNVDLLKKAYIESNDANQKFDIIFIFIKFLFEIKDLALRHYFDLYLLLFHTLLRLDDFDGSEKDKYDLGEIVVKACGRYDCTGICEIFIRDTKLIQFLHAEVINKMEPYKDFVRSLVKGVRRMVKSGNINDELVAVLSLTNIVYNAFDEESLDFINKHLTGHDKDSLHSFLRSRCNELFNDKDDRLEMVNKMTPIIEKNLIEIFSSKSKPNQPSQLFQHQQIKI